MRPAVNANPDSLRKPRLIAITSGSRSVGKTWLSLTLAQAFGQRRSQVLVLDAKELPGESDHEPAEPAKAEAPGPANLATLRGFDLWRGTIAVETLCAGLEKMPYDIVLLDLPAGLDESGRRLAALADTVLLVTTPDAASLTECYAVLKQLKELRTRPDRIDVRVILNQAPSVEAGKRAYSAFSRAARRFLRLDPPLLGIVGLDGQLAEAADRQTLELGHFPQSKSGLEVQMIARRLQMKS